MEKIKQSLFAYYMYELHQDSIAEKIQAEHAEQLKEAQKVMNVCGYFPVKNDLISEVHMENAIGVLNAYLRKLPKRLYEEYIKK